MAYQRRGNDLRYRSGEEVASIRLTERKSRNNIVKLNQRC